METTSRTHPELKVSLPRKLRFYFYNFTPGKTFPERNKTRTHTEDKKNSRNAKSTKRCV